MTARKTTRKKTTRKKAPTATAARKDAGRTDAEKAGAAEGPVRAADVNLGHVFALRPRVNASFGLEHLRRAKDQLAGETWASLPEAARAVAEKAIEIAQETPAGRRR